MLELVTTNNLAISLIALGVFIITILICIHHYKKYSFLQGIFSLLTVPMLIHGLGLLLAHCFKDNPDMDVFFSQCVLSFDGYKEVFVSLLKQISLDKLADTGWFYLPFGIIFILTYGYSITWRQKHKKNKNKTQEQ